MTEAAMLDSECFQTTDGEIAIVNVFPRFSSRNRCGPALCESRPNPCSGTPGMVNVHMPSWPGPFDVEIDCVGDWSIGLR